MSSYSNLASRLARSLAAAFVFASGASQASIVYEFSFSPNARPAYSVTLQYANYVTTTGMNAVTPLFQNSAASVGYAVNYAGTNSGGRWGFDDNNAAIMYDGGYVFNGASFLFSPSAHVGYFTAPGTYAGSVDGNNSGVTYFDGTAVMTIRDTSATVPEPASLALVLLAVGAGAAASRRRAG